MTRSVWWSFALQGALATLVIRSGPGAYGAERPDVVVADFEQETYGEWKVTGEAFGAGPAAGTLPGQMQVEGFEGKRLVNSFHKGDGTTGTLTSPEFAIERPWLNFLIGGGAHRETRIELLVDGKSVRTASGPNDRPGGSERLDWLTWDVKEFGGRKVSLRIVDEHRGGWGHINVDQIVQSDRKRMAEPARWELAVTKKYVWLPVQNGAPKQRMRFRIGEEIVREFEIELARERTDFHVFADVAAFAGKTLVIDGVRLSGGAGAGTQPAIEQHDALPAASDLYRESLRPQFHFTSRRGWLNDPNGLVWADGEYHLYYQHNPYGHEWGNMHWGHAVSPDLLHWRELPIAIYPHRFGDWAFSGSAVLDERNDSGFGTKEQPPLVAAYTSTGRGECIVYSVDQGRTWTEFGGNPVVKHAGRDPRLLWHAASKQWVMALYDEFEGKQWITFHTSPDLKAWAFASRIDGFYECPDIIELPVDGQAGETRWVLYGADAQYAVGTFDGKVFRPEGEKLTKHRVWHGNYYAAQTFSRTPDGRCIQIGWANGIGFPEMPFNQQMAIPVELTLHRTPAGPRLRANPVKELGTLRFAGNAKEEFTIAAGKPLTLETAGPEIRVECRGARPAAGREGEIVFDVGGEKVTWDAGKGTLAVRDLKAELPMKNQALHCDILVDRRSIEVFAQGGAIAISRERTTPPTSTSVSITTTMGDAAVEFLHVSNLQRVWNEAKPAAGQGGTK